MGTNFLRQQPLNATNVVITAVPSGVIGLDLSAIKRGNTFYGPRYAYFAVTGTGGAGLTIAADAEIYVKRGTTWRASGVFRGGKAITLSAGVWAEDLLQACGDAEAITIHVPGAGVNADLEFHFYEEERT